MNIRVGLGTDLHRLESGLPLMLGGVEIPSAKGSKGHSDGDVLIHAICDALLGSLALRDIGFHFPDTDARYKGAPSEVFLFAVLKMVKEMGWMVVNIDATIHLELPKLSPYIEQIQASLAAIIGIAPNAVSIKAKTGERIGMIGSGEAVEAVVVCLVCRRADQSCC